MNIEPGYSQVYIFVVEQTSNLTIIKSFIVWSYWHIWDKALKHVIQIAFQNTHTQTNG